MPTAPAGPPQPALAALGLGAEELAALANQGFVCAEDHGNGHVYHKLRFRIGAKQRVRYLGKDQEYIDRVRNELAGLQSATRRHHELDRLAKAAKQKLRDVKHELAPLLTDAGFVFHGLMVRRPRLTGRRQSVLSEPVLEEENYEESTESQPGRLGAVG